MAKGTEVDAKYLCYDDALGEHMIDGPTFELSEEELKSGPANNLYQNKVARMVESYYEDKYADLEKKRVVAEADLQRTQASQFQRDHSL